MDDDDKWNDAYDDLAQDGYEPTDDMVQEYLEDKRRNS